MRDKSEVVNHKTVQSQSDFLQFTFANAFDDGFSIRTRERKDIELDCSVSMSYSIVFSRNGL